MRDIKVGFSSKFYSENEIDHICHFAYHIPAWLPLKPFRVSCLDTILIMTLPFVYMLS